MNNEFPRILSLLRKERKLSQKTAAKDLGVSQALLSHYEKGIRECGLDFLCRAAAYYGVTTDFLLGRTSARTPDDVLPREEPGEDKRLQGSVAAKLAKVMTLNSVSLLFDGMQQPETRAYAAEAQRYLALCVYKLYRYLYLSEKENPAALFSVPPERYPEAVTAAQLLSETRLRAAAAGGGLLGREALAQRNPQQAAALMKLLQEAEDATAAAVRWEREK